jgi:hypothetical protein
LNSSPPQPDVATAQNTPTTTAATRIVIATAEPSRSFENREATIEAEAQPLNLATTKH